MTEQLRVGLIGLGAVAAVHLEAYRSLSLVKVVAAADPAADRLASLGEQECLRGYRSAQEMLREEDLHIACVLTPSATHEAATLECARAGVNVLCEKPLALSVDACERMIQACRQNGVQLCYGASYRYLPALIAARETILAGDLGDVLMLRESIVGGTGPAGRETLGPAHFPPGGPGGSALGLVDHGVHLIDTFSWLMDSRIQSVIGRANTAGETQRPEYLVLEFENGALGHLLYEDGTFPTELPGEGLFCLGGGWGVSGPQESGRWQAHPGSIHVHGTKGALRIFHYGNQMYSINGSGIRQLEVQGPPMPANFTLQMEAFARAILSGEPVAVAGEAGLEACRALLAVYPKH